MHPTEEPMARTAGGKIKRSYCLEPEQVGWLQDEAERLDRPVNWVLRRVVQAAMDAEARCQERAS